MQQANTFKNYIWLMGRRIRAHRCQALSKRSKLQCKNAALREKHVCRFHGVKSKGPLTIDGKKRCADVKTIHGRETREKRKIRSKKFIEMKLLASLLK
tara:strand:- start:259 stop:552 length:294 start_codon:yes stop_codon:yes gene_type:complete